MSEAIDPTLFQFSVLAYCHTKKPKQEMQEILQKVLRDGLELDTPIERIQVELNDEPSVLDDNKGLLWEGNLVLVLDMEEDTSEADLGIEDLILSRSFVDPTGTCYEIQLGVGSVPHNVKEYDLFDRILDASHNVSEHFGQTNRPTGWYAYPGGGYRFWNGKDWVGEAIEHPPHRQHPQ